MNIEIPTHRDFRLTAHVSPWTGAETLMLDGAVISQNEGFNLFGVYAFDRQEEGRNVRYEVNFMSRLWTPGYVLRRDGIVVSHN